MDGYDNWSFERTSHIEEYVASEINDIILDSRFASIEIHADMKAVDLCEYLNNAKAK